MKKILLSFLLASGCIGIFYSCDCFNASPFWNIEDFSISVYGNRAMQPVNDTIATDTLALGLVFTPTFTASINYNPFVETAFATSCESDGYSGIKDQITGIKVTSEAQFNDIPPDTLLNPLIILEGITTPTGPYSINQYIPDLNRWPYEYTPYSTVLLITTKPENFKTHSFTVLFEFASGRTLSKKSEKITWL